MKIKSKIVVLSLISSLMLSGCSGESEDIPKEYSQALEKAKEVTEKLESFDWSRATLISYLTNENVGYSEEAAEYAVDHLDIDWKENALHEAKEWYEVDTPSKDDMFKYLTSPEGQAFTEEEAKYAIEKIYTD